MRPAGAIKTETIRIKELTHDAKHLYRPTPTTALLEQVALGWLLDLFQLPPECAGAFVTGATMANFSALAAARHAVPQAAGAWVHVDGAFGLWARAAPPLRRLAAGLELADSWATVCHKWLNVPYDSGLALVGNADALRAAMAVTADYLPTASPFRNPSDYTPELSRRARGVEVWAALRSLGRTGVAELIERTCRYARRFAEGLDAAGFEALNDAVLNQVLVRFGDAPHGSEVPSLTFVAIAREAERSHASKEPTAFMP
jgi:glutamate/tyrosine decarboxylase-like PLP-dependent enzyme